MTDPWADAAVRGTALPVSDAPLAETAAAEPAATAPAEATPSTGSGDPVSDAPAQQYIVPFDRNPLSAPGERIIFRALFTDPSPADYQLDFSTTGGHFQAANGPTSVTIAGLNSGNLDFFVPSPWDGTSTVQVVLALKKVSDGSVVQTETWDFGLKQYYPTTITQQEGDDERTIPAVYHYDIGPARPPLLPPFYEHQTILERFSNWSIANIDPDDIDSVYRQTHGLNSRAAISQHFLGNYAGNNGTFTVNARDRIADQHGGHPDLSNLVSNMAVCKDVEVELPQVYEAEPGTTLGSYTVTRILKADGTTWRVKKG